MDKVTRHPEPYASPYRPFVPMRRNRTARSGRKARPNLGLPQGIDVAFFTCAALTASLSAACAIGAYERGLANLARVPLLTIGDFGLEPLCLAADGDLHDLVAERYERCAKVVTSNPDFLEWDQAFLDNRLLASTTLHRLRHNTYCLTLEGASLGAPRQAPLAPKTDLAKDSKNSNP